MFRQKPFFDTALAALFTGVFCATPVSAAVVNPLASGNAFINWNTLNISGGLTPDVTFTAVNAAEDVSTDFTDASDWTSSIAESFQNPSMSAMSDATAGPRSIATASSSRDGAARADAVRSGLFEFGSDGQASISIDYELSASLRAGGEKALAWAFITLDINGTELRDDAIIELITPESDNLRGTLEIGDFVFQGGDVGLLNINVIAETVAAPVPLPGALVLLVSAIVPLLSWKRARAN